MDALWWRRWWLGRARGWREEGHRRCVQFDDLRMQQGYRNDGSCDKGLNRNRDDRGPTVAGLEHSSRFDERSLKHGSTSKTSMCASRRGMRLLA